MKYAAVGLASMIAMLSALPASAAPEPTARIEVAIVPGLAVNVDPARVDALSQELADALATELDVAAIGGLEVRRRLPPEGVAPDCIATPACVADVAQRLGVNQLLFVVMVDTGGNGSIQIDSTWFDPATGANASRPAIDLASVGQARARFAAAARQLLPDAPVRARPSAAMASIGAVTPAAPRHLTRGAKLSGGVALVGLGVGIGFGLEARSRYTACEAAVACSQSAHDDIRSVARVADVGYLFAVGGAITAVVMYATSGAESRVIIAPSSDGVAVSAHGRF